VTIIKRVDEITIYENSDGTKSVYFRLDGQMIKFERSIMGGEYGRWMMWREILEMAETHDDLRHCVEMAETIYSLKS
jgi:hypothetical protein